MFDVEILYLATSLATHRPGSGAGATTATAACSCWRATSATSGTFLSDGAIAPSRQWCSRSAARTAVRPGFFKVSHVNVVFTNGAAGFIGSNVVDRLLDIGLGGGVRQPFERPSEFLDSARKRHRFRFIEGDTSTAGTDAPCQVATSCLPRPMPMSASEPIIPAGSEQNGDRDVQRARGDGPTAEPHCLFHPRDRQHASLTPSPGNGSVSIQTSSRRQQAGR